ncbi:hypothetical protein HA402_000123 [Bradysia odoriphaga]|nr:hypothetical protein HA402_000123 [Bradysia odoriphaga]
MLSTTVTAILAILLWNQAHFVGSQCTSINQLACYASENPNNPCSYARTGFGHVYPDLLSSQTVGKYGPVLLQDRFLILKIQNGNRERIPVRIGHAKGSGASGYFQVTHDVSKYTKAAFLQPNTTTEVVIRFSTQVGEIGSADTTVDAKGFAVKFKTADGIFDFVGLNLPVFGSLDAMNLADLLHSRMKNPVTHLQDLRAFWDTASLMPETMLFILFFFSKTAFIKSYSYMDGHYIHTVRLVNKQYESIFAKLIFTSNAQNKSYFNSTVETLTTAGFYPEFLTKDLYDLIATKNYPTWTLNLQIMTEEQAKTFKYNIFDPTKYWNTTDFPLIPVGQLVLDRNPVNYFNEVEQSAFAPANLVPGIEATPDRLFSARLFAYRDAQFYRLGRNHNEIPVNMCPFAVRNYERDGFMNVGPNGGSGPNYFPNSYNGPNNNRDRYYEELPYKLSGTVDRTFLGDEDNFSQCQAYVNSLSDADLRTLIANMAFSFIGVDKPTIDRAIKKLMVPISTKFANLFREALTQLPQ